MVLRATGALRSADLETVLEAAVDVPKVRGSSGTGGLSSLGLLAPVDCIPHILVSQCSNAIQIPVPGDSTAKQ